MYEAQQAHYVSFRSVPSHRSQCELCRGAHRRTPGLWILQYGLPTDVALASVTTHPAEVMGLGHRVGYVKEGMYASSKVSYILS